MRPIRLPWRRKTAARAAVLAAAREWQEYERQQAYARLAELAEISRGGRR